MHDDPFEHAHVGDEEEPVFGELADDGYPVNPDWIRLTSVGIDIGSSTSHLMFSKLIMRRKGQELSGEFEVVHREVLYRSPILLTPYFGPDTIDTDNLADFVRQSYREAGFEPGGVDTGAVICTGEAVRKHNSENIIRMLSAEAGRFVCATAGPTLEGILGAHGSGAVARSHYIGAGMNVDMGGGTTKISIVRNGEVIETMAISVGARLIAWDEDDRIVRVEHAGRKVAKSAGFDIGLGDVITEEQKTALADALADLLFQALRREELSPLARDLVVLGSISFEGPIDEVTFSGGVAEYVYGYDDRDYGDLGPLLGKAVRKRLPGLGVPLAGSQERIRATVIGASQYTVQVSSSTVFISNPALLPLLDLQVVPAHLPSGPSAMTQDGVFGSISQALQRLDLGNGNLGDQPIALALVGKVVPTYPNIRAIGEAVAEALQPLGNRPWTVLLSADVAGLVGAMLKEELRVTPEVTVVDGIRVGDFHFVDVGEALAEVDAVPVVVKSLVFEG